MARPTKQYNVQLEDDVIERIDRLAEKLELNRSQILKNLLMSGLEDAELINAVGFFDAIKLSKKIRKKIIEDLIMGKLRLDKGGEWKVSK